jgi:hypothetical protein
MRNIATHALIRGTRIDSIFIQHESRICSSAAKRAGSFCRLRALTHRKAM